MKFAGNVAGLFTGRCAALFVATACAMGSLTAAPAWSQILDTTAQTITSPAVIENFVEQHAADLASGDREKVVAARQALLLPGTPNAKSAAFLTVYSKAISTKLMRVADGKDAHAKLNAAIVVGKVAEMGGTADLSPLIIKLISDDASPIATYGIRAASNVLPRILADKNLSANDKIVPAIVAALQKHPTSEAVIVESYSSLIRVLGARDAATQIGPTGAAGVTAAMPRAIDGVIKLLNVRIPQFGKGDVVEPLAELPAVVFLARQQSWAAMAAPTQAQAVKALLGIATGAAAELEIEFNRKPSSRPRMKALQDLIKATGQGLGVIGSFVANPSLTAEADKLKPFNTLTPPAQWRVTVEDISKAYSNAFALQSSASSQPAK